jgi:peptide deformylase
MCITQFQPEIFMILPILTYPNTILRQKAQEINLTEIGTLTLQELIKNMQQTVKAAGGIGLAAPQIGQSKRMIIINLENNNLVLINPKITRFSLRKELGEEGCLSLPGKFVLVKRAKVIKVTAFDENGKELKFKAKDLLARVIQHEIDHLNGVLIIDKAEKIK